MRAVRAILVFITIAGTAIFPLFLRQSGPLSDETAYASRGGIPSRFAGLRTASDNTGQTVVVIGGPQPMVTNGNAAQVTVVQEAAPQPPPPPPCARPGQGNTFTSSDGRVAVTVPPTTPSAVRVNVNTSVNLTTAPPLGGLIDSLYFELTAEGCDGGSLAELSPVNVGVSYSDADAGGQNKQRFTLVYLDVADNQWKPVPSVPDPSEKNYVSATITKLGFYALVVQS